MRILCGTDLSEGSAPALAAAAAVATRLGAAELCVAHVLDPSLQAYAPGVLDAVEAGARAQLEAEASRLRTTARVRVVVHPPSPAGGAHGVADELAALAERESASLLLVASAGHGASPRRRLGGVSERVALTSRVPVLVVRDAAPFEAWARDAPLRILAGVDRSSTSEPALRFLETLCGAGPCDVVTAHVYFPSDEARRYGVPAAPSLVETTAELDALVARDVLRRLGGRADRAASLRHLRVVALGRVGDHLLDLAEREAAALIVVGTRQQRGLARMTSVSSILLHFAHAAVACVPYEPGARAPEELPRLERLLVATDLSAASNAAVAYAYGLLAGRGGVVVLLHVAPPREADEDAERARFVARLRALVPPVADVETRTEVVEGADPALAIRQVAERIGADAICVGSRGRSGVARAVLGSVAEAVLRDARCPVLVARPPPP